LKGIGLTELELSSGNEFVDGQTDGRTDGQTDRQSDYYRHPHHSMRGPIIIN